MQARRVYLTYVFANGVKLYVGGGQKYICEKGEAKPEGEKKVKGPDVGVGRETPPQQ